MAMRALPATTWVFLMPSRCRTEAETVSTAIGMTAVALRYSMGLEPRRIRKISRSLSCPLWSKWCAGILAGYQSLSSDMSRLLNSLDQSAKNITLYDVISDVEEYWKLPSEMHINIAVLKPSLMADCRARLNGSRQQCPGYLQ
jgi:hypothetical protein